MTSLSEVLSSPCCTAVRGDWESLRTSYPISWDMMCRKMKPSFWLVFQQKIGMLSKCNFPYNAFQTYKSQFSLGKCSQLNLPPLLLHI